MYYNKCEHCGAHLDPGEVCDCKKDNDFQEKETEEYGESQFIQQAC